MTSAIKLETDRFILRKIESGDIETLHSYWSDPIVTEHMNITLKTIRESKIMVKLLNRLPAKREGWRWAVVDKESQVVVGSCGYHNVKSEHSRAELGYELGRSFWGKGIMQEVLPVLLKHCFQDLGFNRIEAHVATGNDRSVRTLEKLGFKIEGTLREYEFNQGKYQDQFVMALLRRDLPLCAEYDQ